MNPTVPSTEPSNQPTDKPTGPKSLKKPPLSDRGSAQGYQNRDAKIIDYQLWHLWTPKTGFSLRGPRPASLAPSTYCTSIGAASTFGRFAPHPYPQLIGKALGIPSLNLGFSGVGPSFYNDPTHRTLIDLINSSKFVTIAVFSGRSQANSRFQTASHSQERYIIDDGTGQQKTIPADLAYQQLLDNSDRQTVVDLIAETRARYLGEFIDLLEKITVPKVLLWFSRRSPDYQESYESLFELFSSFPHLLNRPMVEELRSHCDAYVEQIGSPGLPQPLISRHTQQPVSIVRDRDYPEDRIQLTTSELTHNRYYPSPEMHLRAAKKLAIACQQFL